MKKLVSLDISLRSTGICIFDNESKNLIDFRIISNNKYNSEELLAYNIREFFDFLSKHEIGKNSDDIIVIEGLSFNGICQSKDLINGNFWLVRYFLFLYFKNCQVNIIPVAKWRSSVLTKSVLKEIKLENRNKIKKWQKIECVKLLPDDIKKIFSAYISGNKLSSQAIYDLTDSYFLGMYYLNQ